MVISALETLLYCLGIFYALIFLGMIGSLMWNRFSGSVRETYTLKLCECLQPQDHLPEMVFPDIQYAFNRRVLIRLLVELSSMLEGVEGRILRLIFHENGLDFHILRECRLHNDYRKINAMSVFIDIPIPDHIQKELSRFFDSQNNELRMVALLVWLNREPETMMDRLAGYPHLLSDRDCANIYSLAQRRSVAYTEAEKLLASSNPSVVRFGERVLRLNA